MTEKPVTFVVATLLTNPLDMNSEEINAFIMNTFSNISRIILVDLLDIFKIK